MTSRNIRQGERHVNVAGSMANIKIAVSEDKISELVRDMTPYFHQMNIAQLETFQKIIALLQSPEQERKRRTLDELLSFSKTLGNNMLTRIIEKFLGIG